MARYLVTYDLVGTSETSQDYEDLIDAIKTLGPSGKVQKSVWVVVSSLSAVQIRDRLSAHLDSNDRLFVLKSGVEAAWRHATSAASQCWRATRDRLLRLDAQVPRDR